MDRENEHGDNEHGDNEHAGDQTSDNGGRDGEDLPGDGDSVPEPGVAEPGSPESRETELLKGDTEHPLGDYGAALFEYAYQLVQDLAKTTPEAAGLLADFEEAKRSREVWQSIQSGQPISTEFHLPSGPLGTPEARYYTLMPDYLKLKLWTMRYGLTISSTTQGAHSNRPGRIDPHYAGKAVDIDLRNVTPARAEQLMFYARSAGIFVRDEAGQPINANGTPQTPWSNPHIHMDTQGPAPNVPAWRWSEPPHVPGTYFKWSRR